MQNEMVFIIADISGYTKYMIDNETALAHSQGIISELLNAVIKQARIPIRIAKFEGDAVFLFAEKRSEESWEKNGVVIGERLHDFIDAFDEKLQKLLSENTCTCGGCKNMSLLRLKIIAHKGVAFKYKMGKFSELSGKDVIIVHRLLKNSIQSNKYILVTEPTQDFLQVRGEFIKAFENFVDIGEIPVLFQTLQHQIEYVAPVRKQWRGSLMQKKWAFNYFIKSNFKKN